MDLPLRLKMEQSAIITQAFKIFTSNTRKGSITLFKNCWDHVKFFNMILQSPHKYILYFTISISAHLPVYLKSDAFALLCSHCKTCFPFYYVSSYLFAYQFSPVYLKLHQSHIHFMHQKLDWTGHVVWTQQMLWCGSSCILSATAYKQMLKLLNFWNSSNPQFLFW